MDSSKVRAFVVAAGLALVLTSVAYFDASGASGPLLKLKPLPTPLKPPSRSTRQARISFALTLQDARFVRRGKRVRGVRKRTRRLALRARVSGTGRLALRTPRPRRLRLRAGNLARALDGLAGRARIRAQLGGRRVTLSRARFSKGKLVARVRGAGRRPRRLGSVRLAGRITKRVAVRARCVILPFARCSRVRLPLGDLLLADLRGADLRHANLHRLYAHSANFAAADMREADLGGADLTGADLRRADLRRANLADASLKFARIRGARLRGAYLCRTLLPKQRRRNSRDCRKRRPHRHRLRRRARRDLPNPFDLGRRLARVARHPRSQRRVRRRLNPKSPLALALAAQRRRHRKFRIAARKQLAHVSACSVPSTQDQDMDGLTDCQELAGGTLSNIVTPLQLNTAVSGPPTPVSQTWTSDPTNADTDGDGLDDGSEVGTVGSNPGKRDTDADSPLNTLKLNDFAEETVYASSATDADTDNDSALGGPRNRNLYDGAEAAAGMRPYNRDTDGDGLTDYAERTSSNPADNPVVANLPGFTVGPTDGTEINISIPIERTIGSKSTTDTETSTLTSHSHTDSTEHSIDFDSKFTQSFESSGKLGVPFNETSYKVKLGFEESVGIGQTSTSEDTDETENEYKKIQSDEQSKEVTTEPGGCLQAPMTFTNTSTTRSITLSNLQVLPQVPDPQNPGTTISLGGATLQPVSGSPKIGDCSGTDSTVSQEFGPGESHQISMSGMADSDQLLAYEGNPTPITYEMGTFTVSDVSGGSIDYGQLQADVTNFDASVVVDFGSQTPAFTNPYTTTQPSLQTFMVASGVTTLVDPTDGSSSFVPTNMDTILKHLGLNPSYGGGSSGKAKLTGLAGINDANDPNQGLWTVLSSGEGVGSSTVDFPDIGLLPSDYILLTYLDDGDNDGIPDGTENRGGTSTSTGDTDGDGLGDKFETQVGWTVPLTDGKKVGRHVFSSPLSCDADGDLSPDGPGPYPADTTCPVAAQSNPAESQRGAAAADLPVNITKIGTDPNSSDTNEDGVDDSHQSYPQVLAYVPAGGRAPVGFGSPGGYFGGKGSGGGKFQSPTAISIDRYRNGSALVSDGTIKMDQAFGLPGLGTASDPLAPNYTSGTVFEGSVNPQGYTGDFPFAAIYSPKTTTGGSTNNSVPGQVINFVEFIDGHLRIHQFNGTTLEGSDSAYFDCCNNGLGAPPATANLDTDGSGNVYVAAAGNTGLGSNDDTTLHDEQNASVAAQLDSTGHFIRNFGNSASIHTDQTNIDEPSSWVLPSDHSDRINPTGIAVDASGNVFVLENLRGVSVGIRKFAAASGGLVHNVELANDGPTNPVGIAVDGNGYVYVMDAQQKVVYKYSNSLTYLNTFGAGLLTKPIDADYDQPNPPCAWNGNLYVVDNTTGQVQVFYYPHGEVDPDTDVNVQKQCLLIQ